MERNSETTIAGDVTIETYVDGTDSADRPDVVILPSYGRDGGEDFDAFVANLVAAGYRVLRPQPRGTAASAGPMVEVTIEDLADDVSRVVGALSSCPAVVLGHAYGNFVARVVATNHPDQVAAVILAPSPGRSTSPEIQAAPFQAGDPDLPEAERLAVLQRAFFAPDHDASAWLHGWYPETLAMQRAAVANADLEHYWGAGNAPILQIVADLDPFEPPENRDDLRAEYGDRVTTVVIEDASHALFPEQPTAVADAVTDYLSTMTSSRLTAK